MLSPKFIKSAAKEGWVQKGHRKGMEYYKLSQKIGVDKMREEREKWVGGPAVIQDLRTEKKLIVGRKSREEQTQSLSPLSDLRGTACLIQCQSEFLMSVQCIIIYQDYHKLVLGEEAGVLEPPTQNELLAASWSVNPARNGDTSFFPLCFSPTFQCGPSKPGPTINIHPIIFHPRWGQGYQMKDS